MRNEHYHYNIHSYDEMRNEKELINYSEIQVIAENEEQAIEKARKMLVRPHYRVGNVWECFKDHTIEQELQLLQLEMQAKLLKQIL